MKSHDDLLEDCYRFSTIAFDLAPAVFLARFKRREYLRITLRDVLNLASLAETSLELSDLADVLIERALRLSAQHLENMYGVPQWSDASGNSQGQLQPARMTVISLGKLGGQELNYSSDIDLMFLYNHDGTTAGGAAGTISNLEYFVRLAQTILKLLTEATPEGAVFRVDMRLRPEGQLGDLAVSLDSALDYYRTRAREWELQMLIKARVSAGEVSTGETFLREVHPLIFRQEFHLAAVEAVLNAREEITRSLRRGNSQGEDYGAAWNVKLTPGGIRDIEFLAQCLQRVHGGRDPWLTSRGSGSTLVALQHLHDKGYLSQRIFSCSAPRTNFCGKWNTGCSFATDCRSTRCRESTARWSASRGAAESRRRTGGARASCCWSKRGVISRKCARFTCSRCRRRNGTPPARRRPASRFANCGRSARMRCSCVCARNFPRWPRG